MILTKMSYAIAVFTGRVKGEIRFKQPRAKSGCYVEFDLEGLGTNKTRACHIHEFGDLRKGCKSLGSHWNPGKKHHGSIIIDKNNRHSGDLINNIHADNGGNFKFRYYDPLVKLRGSNTIYGRSVVIHYGIDDLGKGGNAKSLKTGNAGGRMACAIIVHAHS